MLEFSLSAPIKYGCGCIPYKKIPWFKPLVATIESGDSSMLRASFKSSVSMASLLVWELQEKTGGLLHAWEQLAACAINEASMPWERKGAEPWATNEASDTTRKQPYRYVFVLALSITCQAKHTIAPRYKICYD